MISAIDNGIIKFEKVKYKFNVYITFLSVHVRLIM